MAVSLPCWANWSAELPELTKYGLNDAGKGEVEKEAWQPAPSYMCNASVLGRN